MTAHVEVMDLVAQMKSAEQAVRAGDGGAHGVGDGGESRREGDHPPGRHHRRGLDRRRLRAGRGAESGARGAADGEPRMVSVQPEDLLAELGVKPGENREGIRFASNMCPSKGTMDIFVEPVLPHPSLVIFGASPVAMSLAAQARQLGYHVTLAAPAADLAAEPDAACHRRRLRAALPQRSAAFCRGLDPGQGR